MREKLKELLTNFVCVRHPNGLQEAMEKLLDDLELEQRKAVRPFCVSLAEVGLAIIKDAQDTCWVSNSETAIDRIFNDLALEMDAREGGPEKQLKDFIAIGANQLWPEKLKEAKSKEPVQLELNLRNET